VTEFRIPFETIRLTTVRNRSKICSPGKDLSSKDKDFSSKDKDCVVKDKDCILVLESSRTRTNITDINWIFSIYLDFKRPLMKYSTLV